MPVRLQHPFTFVQSSGDLPVDVNFCRISFDPHEVELSRGLQSQLRHKLFPQICLALGVQLSLAFHKPSSNTHDIFAVRPDLKVSVLHTHRGDCRQMFRRVVGLHMSSKGERASPVITNTEEDSAASPSEPRMIADACIISLRHNAAVIFRFTILARYCN